MKTKRTRTLYCGCCGKAFTAVQFWNHDTGYGTCKECCNWILGTARWWDQHDNIRKCIATQWPEANHEHG